jgi:hypothetical protein
MQVRPSTSYGATMSDHADTIEAIERHNVQIARRIVEYWRQQGVEIGDPTKELRSVLGPNGLPRGYQGEDALKLSSRIKFHE